MGILPTIPFNKPFIAGKELYYIAQAVTLGNLAGDGHFTQECCRTLEERFGIGKVLLVPSCTAALEMAAILFDIKPGDEVILPSFTFVSTANAVARLGARPVFVDIRPDTLNIDEARIEEAITPRTRALFPVHYAGVGCEMDAIMALATRYHLRVAEDAAQGVNASYQGRPLGSIGHLGCFSFHETKNYICGEGGALCINDTSLVERAEIIRDKGTNRKQFYRGAVDKYTWVDTGSAYVPSEICSAFLYAQLEILDRISARRQRIYQLYLDLLEPLAAGDRLRLPMIPKNCTGNYHLFYIVLPDRETRDGLMVHLRQCKITAVFHYVPLHTSPMGQSFGYRDGDLPVTEDLSQPLAANYRSTTRSPRGSRSEWWTRSVPIFAATWRQERSRQTDRARRGAKAPRREPSASRNPPHSRTKAGTRPRSLALRSLPSVSVVVPVYNSEKTISELVTRMNDQLHGYEHEFVLVNDGSYDRSYAICRALAANDPRIKFLSFFRNFGQLNAILAGLRVADGDVLVVMDDDLQNPPEEVHKLLGAIHQGYDFVFGTPSKGMEQSLGRRLGSYLNHKMAEIVFGKPRDLRASSYYAITRAVAQEVVKYDGPYPYLSGLIFRTTPNGCNVPVEHQRRANGRSNYTFRKLVGLWLRGFMNFSIVPLRLTALVGLAAAVMGGIFGVLIIVHKLQAWDKIKEGQTSIIAAIVFCAGVQLLCLGMLGEYVGRIYLLLNKKPQYTIKEAFNAPQCGSKSDHRGRHEPGAAPRVEVRVLDGESRN